MSKIQHTSEGLKRGLRQDGRSLLDCRPLKVFFNDQNEGVEVDLGLTKVFAKMTANITEPRMDRQNEGFVNIKVDLAFLSIHTSPKSIRDLTDETVKVLEKSIKGSKYGNQGS